MKDYYYILGIKETASQSEIKIAYKKLCKKFHPDLNDNDEYFKERFQDILEAYETLSNYLKKEEYDYSRSYAYQTENNYSDANQEEKQSYSSKEEDQKSPFEDGYGNDTNTNFKKTHKKVTIIEIIKKVLTLNRDFYLTKLSLKRPPLFYFVISITGLGFGIETDWGFIHHQSTVYAWLFNWGISIGLSFFIGYLNYYIIGGIQHLLIRLSGGKRNIDASSNLIIYSDLPYSVVIILISLILSIIFGNEFYSEIINNKYYNLLYFARIISIIFNYFGIRLIHKPKLIPSIVFFILFPITITYFSYSILLQGKSESFNNAKILNNEGLEHYNNKEYEQAIVSFERSIILLEKDDADLLITTNQYLAFTYEELNNAKKAIEYYKASNAYSNNKNPEYHYNIGKILINRNLPKEAIIHFRRALSLDSNHENSLAQLGSIYLGDYSEELAEYNKALKINAQHNTIANDYYSNYNLARNYYYLGRYADSYGIFNKLASEYPDDANVKYFLGFIYYIQGDLSKAKMFILNSIELDPSLNTDEIKEILNE